MCPTRKPEERQKYLGGRHILSKDETCGRAVIPKRGSEPKYRRDDLYRCRRGVIKRNNISQKGGKIMFIRRNLAVLTFVFLWVLSCLGPSPAQGSGTTYQEFRVVLTQIQEAVREKNIALALELLARAEQMLNDLEERPVIDEEALRWNLAQLNLDRADAMQNEDQIAYFANQSVKKWLDYVSWYKNLTSSQRNVIENAPNSNRIQRGVRQLGNAVVRRGNRQSYSIRDLFSIYIEEIPARYFSYQSLRLWRYWLFRCPTWAENPDMSPNNLKTRFESGENVCRDDWEDFVIFLEVWIRAQELEEAKRLICSRWLRDLKFALGYDNGQ